MSHYKKSEITNVFWASNDGFKSGRDPLGIQNSSIATYSILLPGLTNLTSHIRYYSLYCWLLSEYDKLEVSNRSKIHQYDFLRRGELSLALIMKDQGVGGVIGSQFVAQGKYRMTNGIYDIANGADYDSKEKYWSFISGAFGQYYLGSLIYFELVKIEESRFYLRNKGKELAEAVRDSIKETVLTKFLDCILTGKLDGAAIPQLQDLSIHRIPIASKEWKYLDKLLTKGDSGSFFRRDTIFLLLNDMSNGAYFRDFVRNRFLNVSQEMETRASFGWYFYYLCECFHYCIDLFFCLTLDKIRELHNPPISNLILNITEAVLYSVGKERMDVNLYDWIKGSEERVDELYDDIRGFVKKREYISAAVCAITLLSRLYAEYEYNRKQIEDFEKENDLKRQRGIFSVGMKTYVERYLSYSITDFINAIILQIMQEHTVVAITKMGKNNSDLRKFIIEDGHLILVEQRYPVETSPRISSLCSFLYDMGYIDAENKLTDIAINFIENYGKE